MNAAHEEVQRLTRAEGSAMDLAIQVLELANRADDAYIRQGPHEQRRLLNIVLSNCELRSGEVFPTYKKAFAILADLARSAKKETPGSGDPGASHTEWSGRLDSNQRPPEPHSGALPDCATPRRGLVVERQGLVNDAFVRARPATRHRLLMRAAKWVKALDQVSHRGLASSSRAATRARTSAIRPRASRTASGEIPGSMLGVLLRNLRAPATVKPFSWSR